MTEHHSGLRVGRWIAVRLSDDGSRAVIAQSAIGAQYRRFKSETENAAGHAVEVWSWTEFRNDHPHLAERWEQLRP